MAPNGPRIVAVGSAYIDLAIRCKEVPVAGELVTGTAVSCRTTGSGVNQATQAALCGCDVHIISKVGNDALGEVVRKNLEAYGIDTAFLNTSEKTTGSIVTMVDATGENATCVAAGANLMLKPADIEAAEEVIAQANAILLHGAMPHDALAAAIRLARLYKVKVLLDPALGVNGNSRSHADLPLEFFTVDVLLPNIQEAAEIAEEPVSDIHKAKLVGSDLVARGVENVVIKMGRKGCLIVNREGTEHVVPYEVDMVDKTCAGDAFAGAMAACYAVPGSKIRDAVRFAAAAGALACSKFGCQDALPKKGEILELLHSVYTD